MPVAFPHCPGFTVTDDEFLAAWKEWFDRYAPPGSSHVTGSMPRLPAKEGMASQIGKGRHFSLDVLCRMLAPCRNTMQAGPSFVTANAHLLSDASAINPATGRGVRGVKLSMAGRASLATLASDHTRIVRALLQSDLEDGESETLIPASLDELVPVHLTVSTPTLGRANPPLLPRVTTASLVRALVDWIEVDPHQPHYRGQPRGGQVVGWRNRLAAYFWPDPASGLVVNKMRLAPLLTEANRLHGLLGSPWTRSDEASALDLAREIFRWGGVRPRSVTPQMVRSVFDSVAAGRKINAAPMNSGWTKVAALASGACGPHNEQTIWDSRVAHSIIRRLDVLLAKASCASVPPLPVIQDIGRVPGRGGTRTAVKYGLKWPDGYRSWDCQFAGSKLVRMIRDELNSQGVSVDEASAGRPWTLREVEMVLFMDGY